MSTYREIVFLILDEAKALSDDFSFNELHLIFMADKYRALLLKQRYSDIRKEIPDSNYQTVCLDLIEVPAISGEPCEGGSYLRSLQQIPSLTGIGSTKISSSDFFQGDFNYVTRDRMKYVGHNKYLRNMIYTSLAPDGHLYFKSSGVDFLHLEQVKMSAIFESPSNARELSCDEDSECEVMDMEFPLEEALIPHLLELMLQNLLGAAYRPKDENNDASDDLARIGTTAQKSE